MLDLASFLPDPQVVCARRGCGLSPTPDFHVFAYFVCFAWKAGRGSRYSVLYVDRLVILTEWGWFMSDLPDSVRFDPDPSMWSMSAVNDPFNFDYTSPVPPPLPDEPDEPTIVGGE